MRDTIKSRALRSRIIRLFQSKRAPRQIATMTGMPLFYVFKVLYKAGLWPIIPPKVQTRPKTKPPVAVPNYATETISYVSEYIGKAA